MNTLNTLILVLLCIWIIAEAIIDQKSRKYLNKNLDNNKTKLLFGMAQLSFYLGIAIGFYSIFNRMTSLYFEDYPIRYIGVFIILAGMFIRFFSIYTLNRYFTYDLTIQADHKLITHSIYQYIRHPAYLGTITIYIGISLSLSNWLSALFIIVVPTVAILQRINEEELLLADKFKDEYVSYKSGTKKLVPFIY